MPDLLRRPIPSELFDDMRSLSLERHSTYCFSNSIEDRSRLPIDWMQRHGDTVFVEIRPDDSHRSAFEWNAGADTGRVALRSEKQIEQFLDSIGRNLLYVDITGLPHFVWLPLLRAALRMRRDIRVVYAEPKDYVPGTTAPQAEMYELSDKIFNAEPLPGFASLSRDTQLPVLVPLLGFEGGRFSRVQTLVQTSGALTYPLVGLPGFHVEYPFITYYANRLSFRESKCWMNVIFAQANCPFSALFGLEDLAQRRLTADQTIKVALIGTKPHALGALLFFLRSERNVELIYDHPVRRAGRTTGATRCWVYSISELAYRPDRLTSLLASA